MGMIEINGIQLEFDVFDADTLEVYEAANKKLLERLNDPNEYGDKSNADKIRKQCSIVDEFFDSVFGPGTANNLFKGKANIRVHMDAFGIVSLEAQNSDNVFADLKDKYTANRAQRRAQERQNAHQNNRNFQNNHAGRNSGRK